MTKYTYLKKKYVFFYKCFAFSFQQEGSIMNQTKENLSQSLVNDYLVNNGHQDIATSLSEQFGFSPHGSLMEPRMEHNLKSLRGNHHQDVEIDLKEQNTHVLFKNGKGTTVTIRYVEAFVFATFNH